MNERRRELHMIMRMLCEQIEAEMSDASSGPPLGFFVMVFDFGERTFCAHGSNARRADLVKLLREYAERLESSTESTAGDA